MSESHVCSQRPMSESCGLHGSHKDILGQVHYSQFSSSSVVWMLTLDEWFLSRFIGVYMQTIIYQNETGLTAFMVSYTWSTP